MYVVLRKVIVIRSLSLTRSLGTVFRCHTMLKYPRSWMTKMVTSYENMKLRRNKML